MKSKIPLERAITEPSNVTPGEYQASGIKSLGVQPKNV